MVRWCSGAAGISMCGGDGGDANINMQMSFVGEFYAGGGAGRIGSGGGSVGSSKYISS